MKSIHVSFLTWKMTFSRLLGDLSNKPRTVPGCGWTIRLLVPIVTTCWGVASAGSMHYILFIWDTFWCVCLSGFEGDFIEDNRKAKACYCQRQANALWSRHAQEFFKNVSDIYLSFSVCVGGSFLKTNPLFSQHCIFDGILEAQVNLG